jgi:hypothetical protein
VVHGVILFGPQEPEGGHRRNKNSTGTQLPGGPVQSGLIIANVFEHIKHREDVERPGQRVGNRVPDDAKGAAPLAAQLVDGVSVMLGPKHLSEPRQHG